VKRQTQNEENCNLRLPNLFKSRLLSPVERLVLVAL
jgi:hypothetical protein